MFYSGWKHCHGIKFQGIMAPDGMIIHVAGLLTAKHHDMWMLHQSNIQSMFDQHIGQDQYLYIYGDAGYVGSEPWVVYAVCNGHNNVQITEMNY